MTRKEAASILDPDTRAAATFMYYKTSDALQAAYDEACLMGAAALRAQEERDNPKPLTIDELRQMDGEPVWIEGCCISATRKTEWALVFEAGGFCRTSNGNIAIFSLYGTGWLAYRHKPKEDAT